MSEDKIEVQVEDLVENAFDEFISEYELDSEGSINDMFYELFLAGFEAAIEMMSDNDEEYLANAISMISDDKEE